MGSEATVLIVVGPEHDVMVNENSPNEANATVIRVVDGDTAVVNLGGIEETVRFIGVDTPETKHPNKGIECYGPEAWGFTKSLLSSGTPIRLELDAEPRDRYGRLLAYIYLSDGQMLNEILVNRGYARTMTIRPNIRFAARFQALEQEARDGGLGMWGACGAEE